MYTLVSTEFCVRSRLAGKAQALVSARIDPFGDEFREVGAMGASQEKIRKDVCERRRADHL